MVNALLYSESAIFHFQLVRKLLNSHKDILKCLNKDSLKVLDVGCGSGGALLEELLPILPKNFSELVGVDKNDSMIEYCKTLKVDPRVSFHQLDIDTKCIPEKFIGKFDLITSFLCLHYVSDYDQMLNNIRNMLKPRGEFIYLQAYKSNPLSETYRELSKIKAWNSYFKDFENFRPHFSGDNPDAELKQVFQRNGLELLRYKFHQDGFVNKPKHFIELFKSLDTIGEALPEDQKEEYLKDFHKCFSKVMNFDYVSEKSLNEKTEMSYDFLNVYAQKP
ncbi:juvenile hormone acid O-methyltransferase-like [Coccinella septempunctata]|uniref:juvenile hormone acid O-methyltransferase-like n=1 Tax=Coccinella septempunctata TaxID=41139 RepID=UPI001D07BA3D|nr:juvenile hormone acid O-methyltransferase-like [Coccinella septempunctata]